MEDVPGHFKGVVIRIVSAAPTRLWADERDLEVRQGWCWWIRWWNTSVHVDRSLGESVNGKLVIAVTHGLNADPCEQHGQGFTGLCFDQLVQGAGGLVGGALLPASCLAASHRLVVYLDTVVMA